MGNYSCYLVYDTLTSLQTPEQTQQSLHPQCTHKSTSIHWTTPITPGQTPISSYQSGIRALGHLSPLQCSGLVPELNGHPGIHPTCDGAKTCQANGLHKTPTLFPLIVIISH